MTERFPFGPSTRPAPPFSLPLSGPSAALRLAGVAATGRKLEKPVCHYSLSWAKDEKPDRQEMRRTRRSPCCRHHGIGYFNNQ